MAGGLGKDFRVISTCGLEGGIIVELSHTTVVSPVAGIALPIVGLGGSHASFGFKTVSQ